MDILQFINSNAIREHLIKIKYHFTSEEMLYIIWQSSRHTLKEKHRAWTWIIENTPDSDSSQLFQKLCGSNDIINIDNAKSFHYILKKYMTLERHILEMGTTSETGTVFSYLTYRKTDLDVIEDNRFFTDFSCLKKVVEEECDDRLEYIDIKKQWLNSEWPKFITLRLLPNGEILNVQAREGVATDPEFIVLGLFYEMCFPIPTPFKKGDIVCAELLEPFVLDEIYSAPWI